MTEALKNQLRRLVPPPLRKARAAWLEERARRPLIHQPRNPDWNDDNRVAVLLCSPGFRQNIPTSGVTFRNGLANGFRQVGLNYLLLNVAELHRIERLRDPIVILQEADYHFLDDKALALLRRYPHVAWVNTWFDGEDRMWTERFELFGGAQERTKVARTEPGLLLANCVEAGLQYFSGWETVGFKVRPFALACDTAVYDRYPGVSRFAGVKIAFVGGYWKNKARSFDVYLRPYEADLTVYGYSPWPYAGFGGLLPVEDEPLLYRDAVLSPTINEPHIPELHIDINERVFKVLGSGGLTITDPAPGYRALFRPDELLVPETVDEYHDMVVTALRTPEKLASYRQTGYRAVRERHTYAHRAAMMLQALGIPVPQPPATGDASV